MESHTSYGPCAGPARVRHLIGTIVRPIQNVIASQRHNQSVKRRDSPNSHLEGAVLLVSEEGRCLVFDDSYEHEALAFCFLGGTRDEAACFIGRLGCKVDLKCRALRLFKHAVDKRPMSKQGLESAAPSPRQLYIHGSNRSGRNIPPGNGRCGMTGMRPASRGAQAECQPSRR